MSEPDVVAWGIERSVDLLELVDASYPDDRLTLDEIESGCWGEDRVVLGCPDGSAAVSLRIEIDRAVIEVVGEVGDRSRPGAVTPRTLDAAVAHARAVGMPWVDLGGAMPDHLWPGLTAWEDDLVGSLVVCGFNRVAEVDVVAVPTSFRPGQEVGAEVERVVDDDLAGAVADWVAAHLPAHLEVISRAVAQATCLAAVDPASGDVVGVVAHSVGRDGWIGPVVVADHRRRQGIGRRLVSDVCRDLMISGLREAPLACGPADAGSLWPAPFLDSVGARPWRTFQPWRFPLATTVTRPETGPVS